MNIDVSFMFAMPVWMVDLKPDPDDVEWCQQRRRIDPGRTVSNDGGYQSNPITTSIPIIEKINNIAQTISNQYYQLNKETKVSNYWVNINSYNHSNGRHIHTNSFLSGVYYVQAPYNCGEIEFYRDDKEQYILNSFECPGAGNPYTCDSVQYVPEDGRLIIFPSYQSHAVRSNLSKEERISISFNITHHGD